MNERIQQIRDFLNLTQEDFANKILVERSYVSQIERGKRIPSDRIIKSICQVFNVREEWLFTGNGEMFNPNSNELLCELEKKYNMGEVFKNALLVYIQTNELERKVIDAFLKKIVNETNKNQAVG